MLGELKQNISPLLLNPILSERPWGDVKPSPFVGTYGGRNVNWGEIWLAVSDFGLHSVVSEGQMAGKTLDHVSHYWGQEFDSLDQPSVIPLSLRLERTGQPGPVRVVNQPEFWQILETGPKSWLATGTIAQGPWPERLIKHHVEPGDCFVLQGSMVQAQGPEMTVLKALLPKAKIQTLYNWERQVDVWDFEQKGLDLQIVEAQPEKLPLPAEAPLSLLAKLPGLRIELLKHNFFSIRGERLNILCPLSGQGRLLSTGPLPATRLSPGQAVLVPKGISRYTIESNSFLKCLIFSPQ